MNTQKGVDENEHTIDEVQKLFSSKLLIGVSKAKRLYDAGFRTLEDLNRVPVEELANIPGIGPLRAGLIKETLLRYLEESKNAPEQKEPQQKEPQSDELPFQVVSEPPQETVPFQIVEDERPIYDSRPTTHDSRPTTYDQRLTTYDQRPATIYIPQPPFRRPQTTISPRWSAINGRRVQMYPVRRAPKPSKYKLPAILGSIFVGVISILASLYILTLVPKPPITIDGNEYDWLLIPKFSEKTELPQLKDISIYQFTRFVFDDSIFFMLKVKGTLFTTTGNDTDTFRIFIDADGNRTTGYDTGLIGAEYRVDIVGSNGLFVGATLYNFQSEQQNSANWNAWLAQSGVPVAFNDNFLEGEAKNLNNLNTASYLMQFTSKRTTLQKSIEFQTGAIIGATNDALAIHQEIVAKPVISTSTNESLYNLKIYNPTDHTITVGGIGVGNRMLEIPSNEETTVFIQEKPSGADETVYSFGLTPENIQSRISSSALLTLNGARYGGKAYINKAPNTPMIDGAFGEWKNIQTDTENDAPQNIDIQNYSKFFNGDSLYLYIKVGGAIFSGTITPVNIIIREPGEPCPGGICPKPPLLTGSDYLIAVIDPNGTAPSPENVQNGYAIKIEGYNGKIVSKNLYRWNHGFKSPISTILAENGYKEIEFAGSVTGVNFTIAKLFIYMTDWSNTRDELNSPIMFGESDSSTFNIYSEEDGPGTMHTAPLYTMHTPIRIDGNANFTSANGVVSGTGTQTDPYILENWEIDGSGYRYALYIGNTTAYFIVRNNYLRNASGVGSWPYYYNTGLILYNVQNGIVENNRFAGNSYVGTLLISTTASNITNNNVTGNGFYGILLSSSTDIEIKYNRVSSNTNGIYLYFSNNNVLSNNNATANAYGIYLNSSNNNYVTNNQVIGNTNSGIYLYTSNGNGVNFNTASSNNKGIYLRGSSNNEILNNSAFSNVYGIYMESSSNNYVSNNSVTNNSNTGIYLGSTTVTYFFDNMESGSSNWQTGGINNVWQLGTPTSGPGNAYSGTKVWATNLNGNYPNNMNAWIRTLNQISLSGVTTVTLEFYHWFNSEANWDYGYVQISTNGGNTWTTVGDTYTGNLGGWSLQTRDLTPYVGTNILLRFRLFSDFSITAPGWYIDDVRVSGSSGSSSNDIYYNYIAGNFYGIYISKSSSNSITYNLISSNSNYGLYITTSSSGNQIHHNDFNSNNGGGTQGYDDVGSNTWNDINEGNYWTDYDEPLEGCNDVNPPFGICDSPYLLNGGSGALDNYPLTNQLPVPEMKFTFVGIVIFVIIYIVKIFKFNFGRDRVYESKERQKNDKIKLNPVNPIIIEP